MFAGSFFSIFMYAEKAVVWTQRKRGVDERSVYWQCTSLDLMFSRQFEKHGVSRFTCFRSLFGCRRSATRICTWKTNWKKKRNILLRAKETKRKREYRRMFSRLSLFGHAWSVEGVSIYTCRCAGSRQIQDVRFSLLSPCHVSDFLWWKVKRNTSRENVFVCQTVTLQAVYGF